MKPTLKPNVFLALALTLAGCGDEPTTPTRAVAPADNGADTPSASTSATAKPTAPVQSPFEADAKVELVFAPPAAWTVESPTGAVRKAQYRVARVDGDTDDADVSVFFSGPQGMGPIEANLMRWAKQFEVAPGANAMDALTQSQRRVGAFDVTECEISGHYVAEVPPGSGNKQDKPGWRLMGAIVAAPSGPYYIRMLGPQNTVAAHAAEFRAFISGLK